MSRGSTMNRQGRLSPTGAQMPHNLSLQHGHGAGPRWGNCASPKDLETAARHILATPGDIWGWHFPDMLLPTVHLSLVTRNLPNWATFDVDHLP